MIAVDTCGLEQIAIKEAANILPNIYPSHYSKCQNKTAEAFLGKYYLCIFAEDCTQN